MAQPRRVTLQDIADATGLSLGSISLALNGKNGVSAETRRRVVEAARGLGYEKTPRPPAQPAGPAGPATVSVVIERLPVSPTADPFNRLVLQGIETAARRHGYRITVEFAGPEDRPEPSHWSAWPAGSLAGVVVLGGGDLGPAWVRAVAESRLPVVMVDHFVPDLAVPTVVPDNLAGAHAATRHLLEMGHERIGFIRGPSKYWTLGERLAGFLLAMHQAGRWPEPALIPPRVSHGDDKGYGEMHLLLDLPEPPTAVFAVSDKAAVGAYRAALERGLAIPADVSIVGFDDIEVGRALTPALTTVHVPGERLGQVAFERLFGIIAEAAAEPAAPLRWVVPTMLISRASVARRRDE